MLLKELSPVYINKQIQKYGEKPPFKGKEVANKIDVDDDDAENYMNYSSFERLLMKQKFEILGSGSYAEVYGRKDLPYVLKIPFNRDNPWFKFAEFAIKNKGNKHLPKIKFLEKYVDSGFFVAAVEKLTPIQNLDSMGLDHYVIIEIIDLILRNNTYKLFSNYMNYISKNYQYRSEESKKTIKFFQPQLSSLYKITITLQNHSSLDLHDGNIMMRGNTIVITDPWC